MKLKFGDAQSKAAGIAEAKRQRLIDAVESLARKHRDNPEVLSEPCNSWVGPGAKRCGLYAWDQDHIGHVPSRLWKTLVRDAAGWGKRGYLNPNEILAAVRKGLGIV